MKLSTFQPFNLSTLACAVVALCATTAQARFTSRTDLSAGTDANLQNNTIYDVSSDLTLSANAGSSKFRVLGSNVVAINIKKDVTLTLKGGDATGETGAGAAISVASGATLYIMGEGTLVATGGAAGNGCGGSSGGNGWVGSDENRGKGGTGGTGGKGGGGGAAAIGGVGGDGGNGGGGGSGKEKECSRGAFSSDGDSGSPGSSGSNGGGMGRVVILGNVTVKATAGAAATADGSGGGSGSKGYYKWTNAYVAGGGGGGGGGARGQDAQYGIGGGGAGGAGGGGGGGGGTVCNSAGGDATGWGDGGSGGKSYTGSSGSSGTRGGSRSVSLYYGSAKGGGGGEGGAANTKRGDNGTLVIGPSVQFTSSPRRASNLPLSSAKEALYTTQIHFISEGAEVGTATASLMLPMPGATEVTRNGYRFIGYFTEASGGVCIYGPDFTPSSPVWESVEPSVNLYAHWEVAPTMLVVNTNEDGENLGGGKITLRDALRKLCADTALAGTNGLRRIEFDLAEDNGKNVITLSSVIAVDAGTTPIEIDGFNGGKGVTITAGGAFSALQLSGSDVSLRCLNFKNCPKPAIAHSGGLIVEDCSFIGNKGAIQSGANATLGALNCTFADNTAAGGGGAVAMANTSEYGAFVNCTFARNRASAGSAVHSAKAPLVFIHCTLVPGDANALVSAGGIDTYFLNTLIARPSGGTAVTAGTTTSICSSLGTQSQSAILNPPQADDLLGVRHVWYEPVQSSASGNRDAAVVRYDYKLENVAIVTNGVTETLLGNAELAAMPIGIDQLHGARMAPVRGAIRIATGVQPPVVNVEGVAWGLTNAIVSATATVFYDDETTTENIPVTVKTNPDAVFGAAVEVDGSDLYTHNVTEVVLQGLANDPHMIVATSPYALVASSASAIATEDSVVELPGDDIRVTSAIADSLATTRLYVGGESFSAGSLAGFQDITLDDVNVRGGSLRLLGSVSKDGGAQMANLDSKTIGGGEDEDANSLSNGTKSWTARYDGFVQIRAEASATSSSTQVGLTVGSTTVTPMGAFGNGGSRTAVWTVPVRKGEKVTLHANGVSLGYKVQFIYFGVKE